MNFDWSDLAFDSKKEVKKLSAIFIAAPREISEVRFRQLIKQYLPKSNIMLGISKEEYIAGLQNQPQFKTLKLSQVQKTIDLVNRSFKSHKIYTLQYFQHELPHLVDKLNFKSVIFINGSWYKMFHTQPVFYTLVSRQVPYKLLSAFADETEALRYEAKLLKQIIARRKPLKSSYTQAELVNLLDQTAKESFDYASFQTSLVLAKLIPKTKKYKLLTAVHNKVVPYETYAMLNGSNREKNFSPVNDLNHYDTIHAEVGLLLEAQKKKIDLSGTTVFMNLMPCPTCARMLSQTDIKELVYVNEHSSSYAAELFKEVGKKVRQMN